MGRYYRRPRPPSLDVHAMSYRPDTMVTAALALNYPMRLDRALLYGSLPLAALLPLLVQHLGSRQINLETLKNGAGQILAKGTMPSRDFVSYSNTPWSTCTLRAAGARGDEPYAGFLWTHLSDHVPSDVEEHDLVVAYEATIAFFKLRYGLDVRAAMRTTHLLNAQLWQPLGDYLRHLEDSTVAAQVKQPRRRVRETLQQHRQALILLLQDIHHRWFDVEEELDREYDPTRPPSARYTELKAQVQQDLRRVFHALTRYPTVIEDALMAQGVPSASLLIGGLAFEERTAELHAAQATHAHPELDTFAGYDLAGYRNVLGLPRS